MRKYSRGMTLVEILASIIILAIVLALLYGTLVGVLRTNQVLSQDVRENQTGLAIMDLLASDLKGHFYYNFEYGGFEGRHLTWRDTTIDTFSFTKSMSLSLVKPSKNDLIRRLTYYVERTDDDTFRLRRRVEPLVKQDEDDIIEDRVIYPDISQFKVQYYNGKVWFDSWVKYHQLKFVTPLAVRIDIGFNVEGEDASAKTYNFSRIVRIAVGIPVDESSQTTAGGTLAIYTVAEGDTLYSIARKFYNDGTKWTYIFNANRDVLSSPSEMKEGMELKIPRLQQ